MDTNTVWFVVYYEVISGARFYSSDDKTIKSVVGPFITEQAADDYAWKNPYVGGADDYEVVPGVAPIQEVV